MSIPTRNQPLDLVDTAGKMVDAAVAVTTGRLHLASPAQARDLLQTGDPTAVSFFRLELARQIAAALMMMDAQVMAVFEDRDDGTPGTTPSITDPMRLWIQVRYRTAALSSVIDGLDQSLAQAIAQIAADAPQRLIYALTVDDHESRMLPMGNARTRQVPVLLAQRN